MVTVGIGPAGIPELIEANGGTLISPVGCGGRPAVSMLGADVGADEDAEPVVTAEPVAETDEVPLAASASGP